MMENQKNHSENVKIPMATIREIANKVDVHRVLDVLGIQMFRDTGYEMRGCCPIHKGDNPTSFSITYNSRGRIGPWWYCRTGCHAGGDIFELVQRVMKIPFVESIFFVAEIAGYDLSSLAVPSEMIKPNENMLHDEDMRAFIETSQSVFGREYGVAHPDLNDEFVEVCRRRRNGYFSKRGFSRELLDLFCVGFCPAYASEWSEPRVTIPFYFADGRLAGISGRMMYDCTEGKYKIMSGSRKAECLYNLNNALPYIKETQSLIVTEGFAHVWRSWQFGKRNTVAIMGKDMSEEQQFLITSMARTVAVAFDNDEEGRKGAEDAIERLSKFCNVYQMIPPYGKDLADLTITEFKKLLRMAKKVA